MSCCLCFFVLFFVFGLELKTTEVWFFQRVHLYIRAIAGHELGTLSMRVHDSLKIHDNSWALKFHNFSEFQNVIKDCPPSPTAPLPPPLPPQRRYGALPTNIDLWLTPKKGLALYINPMVFAILFFSTF